MTADADRVGHKFARLELMRRAGLPVPELFCLPATDFDDALAATAPPPRPDDPGGWCAEAAEALRRAPVPAAALAAFDASFRPADLVAVRACAVPSTGDDGDTGEDGADPFAGMSDSYLYVSRDRVPARVADCWASAFTARAVAYRQMRGLDPTRSRIAVGVQRMVPGVKSFVAFTRDPRDGAERVVIAAAHGIGEGVVQERADIDHFYVAGGGITSDIVRKERMVGPSSAGSNQTEVLPVPAELAGPPVLTEAAVHEIAALAVRVERLFGGPQDIEGVIAADGAVWLVQARPMTPAPAPVYWCNHNITESYPGISGVLTYSQAREFYRRAFGDFFHRMGVPRRRLDAHRHHLDQMVGYLDGRVYYRLVAWHALHGQYPAFELFRPQWEQAMGVTGQARQGPRWSRARVWSTVPGLGVRMLRQPGQTRAFLRWWDGLMDGYGDLSGRSPDELVDVYRHLWEQVSVRWGAALSNAVHLLLGVGVLDGLLRRWTGGQQRLLTGLLVGGRTNRSLAAVHAAVRLAELVAADAELSATVLEGGEPQRVWREIARGRYGEELRREAIAYVRRYGDRAMHDLKLEEPTPRQRPWMVLDLIRPYVRQGRTLAGLRADEAVAARLARAELVGACPNPVRRGLIRLVAAGVRAAVRAREDTRFCRTQLYGLSRDVMWRLGAELARAGCLDAVEDVRDLTVAEVLGAFDGTLPGADLRGLVRLRRAERERNSAAPPRPSLLSTAPGRPVALGLRQARPVGVPDGDDASTALRGLASSAGVVRAPARLVLGTDVTAESCAGRILIARETDPGWLFLMMAAEGLVVERGTLLSHTAVTGRLLGIPTVVGVRDAVSRIPDGALIEIDGGAGTVRVLDGHPR